jgi:hypothetical protein
MTVHLVREHVQSRTYKTKKISKVVIHEYKTVGGRMMENEISQAKTPTYKWKKIIK